MSANTRDIRKTRNKKAKKLVMKNYLMSERSKRGYRRKIYAISQDIGISEITVQRLADQVRVIKSNNEWLSKVEIEEIKRINQQKQ